MKLPLTKSSHGEQSPASLIAALGFVALVPAVGVLWFMSVAMRNERLAVQERLTEAYSNQLVALKHRGAEWVRAHQAALAPPAATSAPATFAALIQVHVADSVVIYHTAGGPSYPTLASTPNPQANARLLQLRTLGKGDGRYAQSFDHLVKLLSDYRSNDIPSTQRRFLMHELLTLDSGASFPTLAAEDLAAEYLEREPAPPDAAGLQRSGLAKVWRLSNADRSIVALWHEARLETKLAQHLDLIAPPDVRVKVLSPGAAFPDANLVPPQDLGETMPGWRIALAFRGVDPFTAASARQRRFYLWTGFLVVATIALSAFLVARYVGAQMRLARLKNELVSTVSHELKTPLASMRALVDTLLADRCRDATQRREYLQLVAKENLRLSHLIENFLAFSRMERGQQRFAFEPLPPATVVATAVDALQEKLSAPDCRLATDVPPGLPPIRGDADALATVLINLLDNACKYTPGQKQIGLRAFAENGHVAFEVADNGIGIDPQETRRIFERFYQVDQSLTRQRGGCGLGLSIVDFIVKAHRGAVRVDSVPGRGSTFRVTIPLA